MSPTCPECNLEYAEGDEFCSACGMRLDHLRATSHAVPVATDAAGSPEGRASGDFQEDSDGFVPLPLPPEPPVRFWQVRGRNGVVTRWWVVFTLLVLALLIAAAFLGAWLRADDDGSPGATGIASGARGVVVPTVVVVASTPALGAGEPATIAPAAESRREVTIVGGNENGGLLATEADETRRDPMFTDVAARLAVAGIPDMATIVSDPTPAEPETPTPTTLPPTTEPTSTIPARAATAVPTADATVDVPGRTGFAPAQNSELGLSASANLSALVQQATVSESAAGPPSEPVIGDGTGGAIGPPGDIEPSVPTVLPTTIEGE